MSWINTTFENEMKNYFSKKGDSTNELFSQYESIRNSMYKDGFFGEIKGIEPDLSDHSEKHIKDVFERAFKVMGEESFNFFNVTEIYCLGLMILFHDVGNIFGRKGHEAESKIAEIYNKYRANHENFRAERRVLIKGASAHSGTTKEGSKDTLKKLSDENLDTNEIRLQELAAILRFSDELAEGKQRTCSFLIDKKLYKEDSLIYHKYAQITSIYPDRKMGRISITYDIDIPTEFNEKEQEELKQLLRFTYLRAYKLDEERRYTKNYSNILKGFTNVSVVYNFTKNHLPIDLNLGQIIFEDTYPVPGEDFVKTETDIEKVFSDKHESYNLEKIIDSLI